MGSIKDRLISMLYPVYGFRLNEEDEDTKCKDLRRRDLTEAFVGQTSAHGPPHIYGARGMDSMVIVLELLASYLFMLHILPCSCKTFKLSVLKLLRRATFVIRLITLHT